MGLMSITIGLVVLNIVVLLYLFFIQLRIVNKFKSGFAIGLFLFILVFLIENIVSLYFYLTMMHLYAVGTDLPVFVLKALESLALLIYLWLVHK